MVYHFLLQGNLPTQRWNLCSWDFLGKSTGVHCHFLLQGIFLIQGSNLVSCIQADSLPSEPPGNPHASNYPRGLFLRSTWGLVLFLSRSSSPGAPSGSSCSSALALCPGSLTPAPRPRPPPTPLSQPFGLSSGRLCSCAHLLCRACTAQCP